jgi:uncharacterized membrane protein YkoI
MRSLLASFFVIITSVPVLAQGEFSACVSPKDMSAIVSQNKFIAPTSAVVTVRRNIENADVVKAELCQRGSEFVYVIVALKKDGRAVQVLINPESGKIVETQ